MKTTCEICGKEFNVRPYRIKTARFCSFVCSGKWHATNRLSKLGFTWLVGNQFAKGNHNATQFTSERVSGKNNARWVEPVKLTCTNCQKVFEQKPWLVRQNKTKSGYKFCSQKCKGEFMRGENNPLYVGGAMTYRGRDWEDTRQKAIKRDKGTCQDCGKKMGKSIPVHHIKPFREVGLNNLDNLVCLCQSCHMKRERVFPLKKL